MIPIKINNKTMPGGITKYSVKLSDIDGSNSGRSESGKMNRERIRANIAAIDLEWKMISTTELSTITTAIAGESFDVSYFYGSWKNAEMYAGDRSVDLTYIDGEAFWTISFSLVEM